MPNTKAEEKTEIYEHCSNITHRNLATKPSFSKEGLGGLSKCQTKKG